MSLCASAEACMKALLGLDLPQPDATALDRPPQLAAQNSMEKTIAYHSESQNPSDDRPYNNRTPVIIGPLSCNNRTPVL